MNRIPAFGFGAQLRRMATLSCALALAAQGPAAAAAQKGSPSVKQSIYKIEYVVTPQPTAGGALVELRLRQPTHLLREMNMRAPAEWINRVTGDGSVTWSEDRIHWEPPAKGGVLRWFANINHQRDGGGFDSYIDSDYAVFRADDVFPAATTRTLKGAYSDTSLSFDLPRNWSSATQYYGERDRYPIRNDERRFDRPTGWIALGRIGVRNETIDGVRVKVVGPVGHSVRRMDMLALLRWTLPEVARVFTDFPDRLTIVSAGDPMWRGGLSGPASLFLHAERPMISENATSTLVHEMVHVGFGKKAAPGADWIVEGIAELYSLDTLRRSGTISQRRFETAMKKIAERGARVDSLCSDSSRGAMTARAVVVLHELDRELRKEAQPSANLDDVVNLLLQTDDNVSVESIRGAAQSLLGKPAAALRGSLFEQCS